MLIELLFVTLAGLALVFYVAYLDGKAGEIAKTNLFFSLVIFRGSIENG